VELRYRNDRAKRTLAEIVMCARQAGNDSLIKPQWKTGPLCSSHLHKGPVRLFVARIFCDEGCRRSVLRRAQRTSDAIRMLWGFVERLLLFLLGRLLRLSSLPSSLSWPCCPPSSQKLSQCRPTIDMHAFRVHH